MAKSKQIAKLLKADISMTSNLAEIAKMLEKKGRGGDTILAHITRREAEMLKDMGGAGTVNPETGLLEFYDGYVEGGFVPDYAYGEGAISTEQGVSPETGQIYQVEPPAQMGPTSGSTYTDTQLSSFPAYQGMSDVVQAPVGAYAPVTNVTAGGFPAAGAVTPTAPGVTTEKPVDIGFGPGKMTPDETEKSFLQKIAGGLTSQDMIRLGLAGGLGLIGQQQAKKAAGQAGQAAEEQRALGVPYQTKGKEMVRAAEAGELTPTGQQALRAVQAQVAQGVEQRGGVGAQQAAAQVEAFRQQLLQQQYNYGLQVAQIGDSIALGAIKTGLQADQAVQQATNQFYTSLASVAAGLPLAGFAQRTTT